MLESQHLMPLPPLRSRVILLHKLPRFVGVLQIKSAEISEGDAAINLETHFWRERHVLNSKSIEISQERDRLCKLIIV